MPQWFAVFPDNDAARAAARLAATQAADVIRHPSGRPWLLGDWSRTDLTIADAGTTRLALIGHTGWDDARLGRWAARIHSIQQVDELAGALPGSAHLIAAVGDRTRVQGTVSGTLRTFHALVEGACVAASRADILAAWIGAPPALERIAARLLAPRPPHPVAGRALWRQIRDVPSDHYLLLGDSPRTVRWWRPPDPGLPLADGARALVQALGDTVTARAGTPMTADLNGALDTALLCHLAVTAGAELAVRVDDGWADRALTCLPGATLLPGTDRLTAGETMVDEPPVEPLSVIGAGTYLSALGAVEATCAPAGYLHGLLRRHPWLAADHLRAHLARRRWPLHKTIRLLSDRRTWRTWLTDQTTHLTGRVPGEGPYGWGRTLRLPPWCTPDAVDAVRDLLRRSAATAAPLHPDRGQHAAMEAIQGAAATARLATQALASAEVTLHCPYLDDRVIEACLAVLLHERAAPWRNQSLLAEAARGTVPNDLLVRRTARPAPPIDHRTVLEFCEQGLLAAHGLIDPTALRTATLAPTPATARSLQRTLATETWLRTHTQQTVPTPQGGPVDP